MARRWLLLVAATTALATAVAAAPAVGARSAAIHGPIKFKVRLIQEQTVRHVHPPDGNAGDTFSTTLKLFAIGTVLGFPDKTPMGSMAFTWGPLNGTCSSSAAGCSGTTNLETVTKLPGGTITASGTNISLSHGLVVPVQSGTGIFKGVKGTISIAPQGDAEDVFNLVLP